MKKKTTCDFCGNECDKKLILRDAILEKQDGSPIILCSDCFNHYANGEYDKIQIKK